jgi:hypothetical protein
MTIARFSDAESATAYRDACNAAEGLPKPGTPPAPFPYGWTLSWADVVEQDGAFAVPVHGSVPVPEGVPVVVREESF